MSITLQNRVFYIFVLLFCFVLKIKAQFLDKKIYLVDSIEEIVTIKDDRIFLDKEIQKYRSAFSDTLKIQILVEIVEGLHDEKIWIKYNRLMRAIAEDKIKTSEGRDYFVFKSAQSLALNNFGYYYFNYSANYDLALDYYYKGLKINEELKNYKDLVASYSNVGNVYQNRGDINKALEFYQKSINLETKVKDKLLFLAPLNNLAQVYLYLNDTARALQTLKKTFVVSENSNDRFMRGSLLHNIGVLSFNSRTPPGIDALYKALALRKEIGDKKGIMQTHLSLASIENAKKNFEVAENYIIEAAKFLDDFKGTGLEALYYNQVGSLKESTGHIEEAIHSIEKSVAIYSKISLSIELGNSLRNLIVLYGTDNKKYSERKLVAYELLQKVMSNMDKTKAQKLLLKQKYEEDLRINEAKFKLEEQLKEEKTQADRHKQQLILGGVSIILLVVLLFSFFIYKALKENQKKNKIISEQKVEVEKQKLLIEEKHKDITDSINYAQKIQHALTVSDKVLQNKVRDIFVIYKPKDIVSGDFYWYSEKNNLKLLAVADCTGHGVPGAFMSMIGITMLNQIVNEKGITSPAEILNLLRDGVINSLNQTDDEAGKRDGMDVVVVAWNESTLIFAGANNPCLMMRENNFIELKPNKQPVGLYEKQEPFTEQKIDLQKNDSVFLFSDGITDQFGGERGKKIKLKGLKEWLTGLVDKPAIEQKQILEAELNSWKGQVSQTDDILLIGFKV